ncbi:uncharacterized protein LOC105216714 [Zeugodacus cucurbitae]|uniref:uncharacterized protein LOC105216714 n=1 Tax=Zeugodacus cucurbitae TaxID=28588 RepID=UPI000596A957|nr:uncharacterized protein LOC105216714 [Zeugodacus cucurbitae]
MRTHLQYRRHSSGAFLSALLLLTFDLATSFASPSEQTTSFEQLFSTDPNNAESKTVTPLYDDEQLKNVAQQVTQIKNAMKNIFLLLDSYNLRLDYIKKLLDERLPEAKTKPHGIDVRGEIGESISLSVASTGGVVFPSLGTQSSASSQSSAGGVDVPVISTQSSAGGVNIPATDLSSFIGEAYLPAIGTKSSESAADISSRTTDSSTCYDCNSQT